MKILLFILIFINSHTAIGSTAQLELMGKYGHKQESEFQSYNNYKNHAVKTMNYWSGDNCVSTYNATPDPLLYQDRMESFVYTGHFKDLSPYCKKNFTRHYLEKKAAFLGGDILKDKRCQNGCFLIEQEMVLNG